MSNSLRARACVALFLACSAARADVYVLGSSYSEDAIPSALDNRPQWHIDCGKPLKFIYDNPQAPCNTTSTIWPVALAATQFQYISFQPVAGTGITQQSDLDTIGYWMSLQPGAIVVIHPTWPLPSNWDPTFHDPSPDNSLTHYSQRYYYDLIAKLKAAHPGRTIVTDRSNEMLDSIYHDIQNGIGPLTDFQQLFRDAAGHSSENYGKYLQHNALRQAFGQRTGVDSTTPGVATTFKTYLNQKIAACPPRSTFPPAGDTCAAFGAVQDAYSVTQDTPANSLNVLANDAAVTNPVTVTVTTPAAHGTATPIPAGPGDPATIRINYVPAASYVGPDSFVYQVATGTKRSHATVTLTILADTDHDGVPDVRDNCINVANADQRDTDGDGYGNLCDADLNNDGRTDTLDLDIFKAAYGKSVGTPGYNANADFNGDGRIDTLDLNIFKSLYRKAPGPSGLHP